MSQVKIPQQRKNKKQQKMLMKSTIAARTAEESIVGSADSDPANLIRHRHNQQLRILVNALPLIE
ncbi:MAG: hypothetical protein ORN51_16040 [Akkermansiaceae bacterium]|nr:hypothetical protein [Akkermansiaceae bacterium]